MILWNDNILPDTTEPYQLESDGRKLFVWVRLPLIFLTLGCLGFSLVNNIIFTDNASLDRRPGVAYF